MTMPEPDLPDYSADWQLPDAKASNAEIEARFYYEFARESQAILSLTEKLSLDSKPLQALFYLQYPCFAIAGALMPKINLRETSWQRLEPKQKRAVIASLAPAAPGPAFDSLDISEAFYFASAVNREFSHQFDRSGKLLISPRSYHRVLLEEKQGIPVGVRNGAQFLNWSGVATMTIKIDWAQGVRAVEKAMTQWFEGHKQKLLRLKSKRKLVEENTTLQVYDHDNRPFLGFRLREQTGAGTRSRKYLTALRRLGAMRLLGKYSFAEAVAITKEGMGYPLFSDHRSAWNNAVKEGHRKFQDLFYPSDRRSVRMRRNYGLPVVEKPISYQRYCRRTNK